MTDTNDDSTTSIWGRIRNHPRWSFFSEASILAMLLLIVTAVYAFIQVADEIRERETGAFDATILRWFRNPVDLHQTRGPDWLVTAAIDATALGGTTVLIFVVVITLGFLWIAKKRKAFLLFAAAAIGGQLFNSALKHFFSRPRPDIVPHLAEVHSPSFPSGHSMMSAVIFLTMGALLSRLVAGKLLRGYIMGVSILLTIIVGITRLFLGVHYPTDVIGGWSAGLAWALICLLVAEILQHRGKVEQPGEHTDNPLHG